MGGLGSGGRRTGSGRKQTSDLELAIGGTRTRGDVVPHPSSSTAVAAVTPFDPPADLERPPLLEAMTAALASADGEERERLQARVDELTTLGRGARAVWQELAPHAFAARTLSPATTAVFVMLCRAIVRERDLSLTDDAGAANHRGLLQRISTWTKDFSLAPLGKPMYAAAPVSTSPLDRFTRRATDGPA